MFDGEEWRAANFAALADYANGRAFKPEDWGEVGLRGMHNRVFSEH